MGNRKPKAGFFVIIFEGRTGSSYTVSCLNGHPHVLCYPEVLARENSPLQKKILNGMIDGAAIEQISSAWINPHYFHTLPTKRDVYQTVGFKTKLQDVWQVSQFDSFLHQHKFRLIYLKRRNLIKSALSMLNARRLVGKYGDGNWNASHKEQVQGAFYVPPDALIAQLQKRIRLEAWHQRFFDLYAENKQQFFYEDLLEDEAKFMRRLLSFLDVDDKTVQGLFFKNTPDQLEQAILNYDEIRSLFVNTYFERFFGKRVVV